MILTLLIHLLPASRCQGEEFQEFALIFLITADHCTAIQNPLGLSVNDFKADSTGTPECRHRNDPEAWAMFR